MWNEIWEIEFALNLMNEAECLICSQNKCECYLKRHYDRCHSDKHSITGNERISFITKLKNNFRLKNERSLNVMLNKHENISIINENKATYQISLALAKKGRPFEDGQFFKDICLAVMPYFGESGQNVSQIMNT